VRNRWIIALAGTLLMACLGTVYSWSLFFQPLQAAFGWSATTTTAAFALAIFFLGVGAAVGGRWQDRAGPRRVALTGALLWGAGNVLAGLGTARLGPAWLWATYGVMGGLGLGLGYVSPVAAVTKWFPGRRGLGSGLVVMGFGLGAFLYNLLLARLPATAGLARSAGQVLAARIAPGAGIGAPALPPEQVEVLLGTFLASGLVFAAVGGSCAALLDDPPMSGTGAACPAPGPGPCPAPPPIPIRPRPNPGRMSGTGAMPGTTAPDPPAAQPGTGAAAGYTAGQAAHTRQLWALFAMLFLNVAAGILFISSAVPIMRELTGAAPAAAVAVYGAIALANGLGRFLWGAVSDRIGRRTAYALIYGTQVVAFLVVGRAHGLGLVAALFAVVLLCYGGGFGVMPSLVADWFGTRHLGQVYGLVLLAWGCAGVVGPLFAARVKDLTGSYAGALPAIAGLLALATLVPLLTRPPPPPA